MSFLAPAHAQSKKYVISVIGSSTAFGEGASPLDSSYVNLTRFYYKSLGELDTIYDLGVSGQVTYQGMPTGFTPPSGRPAPDTASNITKALSFHPDVVLVNFPTNDAAEYYSLSETMSNLRTIYQTVINAGKICYITTSQPRNTVATSQQELLKTMRDSVLAEFPAYSLNFYNVLVAADSLSINPLYNVDGTHVNNAGHRQLFNVVKAADILAGTTPLALTLLSFTAVPAIPAGQGVTVRWTVANDTGPLNFAVQRSLDGKSFGAVWQQQADPASGASASYSWTDNDPLPGTSYYRLNYSNNQVNGYSDVVTVNLPVQRWGIGKFIAPAGATAILAEVLSPSAQTGMLSVFNMAGQLVYRRQVQLSSPSALLSIPVFGWAAGQYFLHIVTGQGNTVSRAFLKF